MITTTDRAFAGLGQPVDVSAFTRPQSVGYLRARTGLADQDGADTVAQQLGDLPLGLAQAAATITRQHLTYPTYLQRLRQVPVRELLGRSPGEDYPHATAAALLLSVQATEASDPTEITSWLLRILAALSPDGIPRALLDGLPQAGPARRTVMLRRRASRRREWEVDAAIERCVAGSLLEWSVTGGAVLMHRLLARVLREQDQAHGHRARTVTAALNLLQPLLFPEEQAWSRREEGAQLAAQVEALWDAGAGTGDRDLALRQLRARSWAVRQLCAAADLSRAPSPPAPGPWPIVSRSWAPTTLPARRSGPSEACGAHLRAALEAFLQGVTAPGNFVPGLPDNQRHEQLAHPAPLEAILDRDV